MNLIITSHAKQRMIERNISEDEIREVIDFPDYAITKDNLVESHKHFKNKFLKIVFLKERNFIKIITVIDKSW